MRRILTLAALMAVCAARGHAQPEIGDDGRVTFTYTDAKAEEVRVKGTDGCGGEMRRKGDTWTLITKPLTSDLYTYRFVIDDEHAITDPGNKAVARDVADTVSYFCIKGWPGSYYMDNDVPHGTMQRLWYPSSLKGMKQRRLTVYLPPGYDSDTARTYPVLYLLHGSGGDEEAWPALGRLAQIMDNMIAEGRCRPMVVVMPNGNADIDAAPEHSPYMDATPQAKNVSSMRGTMEKAFMREVLPFVEKRLRVSRDRGGRAIAGLSLGGLHTLFITANNPQTFDYVGLFSAQTTNSLGNKSISSIQSVADGIRGLAASLPFVSDSWREKMGGAVSGTDDLDTYADVEAKLVRQFKEPPRLYYIAVGKQDFVKKLVDNHRKRMDRLGLEYVYNESGGGHTWRNWRRYLLDFLPMLFKDNE